MRPISSLPALEVYMLGLVDFAEIQQLQRRIVYEQSERGGAALILCEHPPTISIGRAGTRAHIAADDELLRNMGIRTYYVNRGGGCILHLPGQLAACLVFPLEPPRISLQAYLDRLHLTIVKVLAEFDLTGITRPGIPGVFLDRSRVATVGIAVNRWIAYHGITLNVGPYLELFDLLEEPGIGSSVLRQTSMESRRQRAAPMAKVRESLIRHLEEVLELERHHIYTQHPQIRRKVLVHAYAPSPG